MKRYFYVALLAMIHVITFAQYEVGHTTITFNDPARTGGFGSGGGPGRQIQTEIYYPADVAGDDVDLTSGEFPVIAFGHGFAMSWDAYQNIWEYFATRGYIIAFPRTEGGLIPGPSHEDFGKDLSLVLDKMLLLNDDVSSIFSQGINGKGAIMGHSMGGGSTFLAAAINTNAVTVVGLAPAETDPSAVTAAGSVTVPALVLSGSSDGVTPAADHHTPIYNALASDCKHFLSITGGAHCYFANSNFNCDFGEGTSSSGISVSRTEQQETTYAAVLPWFDFYLKGMCARMEDFVNFKDNDNRVETTSSCNYELPTTPVITEQGSDLESTEGPNYQWYKDDVEINGATNQTLTPSGPGEYKVVITDEYGCTAESEVFVIELNIDVDFTSDVTAVCPGGEVTFTDESQNDVTEWEWTFEGGTPASSTDQNPVVTYATAGTYTVTLAATNADGTVTEEKVDYITVHEVSTVEIEASAEGVCPGGSLDLTASGAESYEWDNGLGADASITVSPTEATIYTVIGTDANGCESTNEIEVTIFDAPEVGIEASTESVCPGGEVILEASGAETYQWEDGLGADATITVNPTETTIYTVFGTDANGCEAANEIEIEVTAGPEIGIEASAEAVCPGEEVLLEAFGGEQYTWEGGLGSDASITVTPTETTVYTVIGFDENGCQGSSEVEVQVTAGPEIGIEASATEVCPGGEVVLEATGAEEYTWEGGLGSDASITVSPTENTIYTVVGWDENGCQGMNEIEIAVLESPEIGIEASATEVCPGETVQLEGFGGVQYTWEGGLGSAAGIEVSPEETTVYTLVGWDDNGCEAVSEIEITVIENPEVEIESNSITVCEGESIELTAVGADSFEWGDGLGTDATVTVTPDGASTYTVVGTNAGLCSGEAEITISTVTSPEVIATASEEEVCAGESVILTGSGADSFEWDNDVDNDVPFVPTETATYTVTGTSSCGTGTAEVTVVVNPLPEQPVVTEADGALSVEVGNDETVVWLLDGEVVSDDPSFEPEEDGVYVVEVTNEHGCTSANEYQYEDTASLTDNELGVDLSVYPNPTEGKFVVEVTGQTGQATIALIDVLGRTVTTNVDIELSHTTQVPLDITGMQPGVYLLILQVNDAKKTMRVVLK